MHWVLDVTFREDECRTRQHTLANNLSWLRRFAVTLLKRHPIKDSIRGKMIRCLMNIQTMLKDDTACVLVVGDVEMTVGGRRGIVETGDQIASRWSETKNTEMEVEKIILDAIPLKSRRYIHVPITKGIKQERIVIFHKGKPRVKEPWIDWTQRPMSFIGPDWATLYE